MPDPVLHLVVGPNGAGKSTFHDEVIAPVTGLEWVNADAIAADRWPGDTAAHAYQASALAAARRAALVAERRSFATETVFSHPSKLELVDVAEEAGYLVTLHVILVPEALAVARVADRVEHGGHAVPEAKVRERYRRLWPLVAEAMGRVDTARAYDNSRAARPFRLVATFERGRPVDAPDWPAWAPAELVRGWRGAGRSSR